jgi:hypothetical protein
VNKINREFAKAHAEGRADGSKTYIAITNEADTRIAIAYFD